MDLAARFTDRSTEPTKSVGVGKEAIDMMAGWDMNLAGWIWMLVWVAALLLMVWLVVRRPDAGSPTEDPSAILRARFARGEISQEEFERARDVLLTDRGEPVR